MDTKSQDGNSKRTRIEPVFAWLERNGGPEWPTSLLRLATGISIGEGTGVVSGVHYKKEKTVPPTPERLAWMIRNVDRLTQDRNRTQECATRVNHPSRDKFLRQLDGGDSRGLPRAMKFEESSHCDCLIECEKALIWVEGKRNDILAASTTWDVHRDQISRNLEAVWSLAKKQNKDYWLLICYETTLKRHEGLLIDGYRSGSSSAGWPHLEEATRIEFSSKIGTVRWKEIADRWPDLRGEALLTDIWI